MFKTVIFGIALVAAVACNAKPSAWQNLSDGNLDQWRGYKNSQVPSQWRIDEGVITLESDGSNRDLVTKEQFGDFELQLEWKISPGGNSGIIYLINERADAPRTYSTGPEMQILDDARHPDGKLPSHRAGCLYDLITCKAAARPVGKWNSVRIKVKDGRIDHWLNGKHVISTSYGDDDWRTLVAGSKFAKMSGFGTATRGHIALQDHGDRVWFRKVRVRGL